MRLPIAMLGTLVALLLSPAVDFVRADETEDQAVAAIEKLGGVIQRDEEKPGKPVVQVILDGTKIADASLAHLKGMKTLESLSLIDTNVSDAGLVHLNNLKQLCRLDLDGTKVTDTGLVHIKDLKQLRWLLLNCTKVTDAGLVHLNGLKELEELEVSKTKVTEKGVKALKKALPDLKINK